MPDPCFALAIALIGSIAINILCIHRIYKFRDCIRDLHRTIDKRESALIGYEHQLAELKKSPPQPAARETLTIEAQQLLHDLTRAGEAIVRIIPLNPADIFWRSPK